MARIFGVGILVSAALLFCLQPLVGKMLLAPLGGAPAVWNTCMVFFQALLLGGYVYAHLVVSLELRKQAVVHLALVAVPWLTLPIAIHGTPGAGETSTFAVLGVLARSVGLPFFVLSTTAPLLQRWFAQLGTASGKDPYFLYAASNLGSMVALIGYPILVEPLLGLHAQARVWAAGYALFGACIVGCVYLLRASRNGVRMETDMAAEDAPPVTWGERVRWIVLSLVPSSLLMGVTQHVTTDIAAIPLFWVVPLALYLMTFMLVFAKKPPIPHRWMVRIFPLFATITLLWIISEGSEPRWLVAFMHVSTAFVAFMVCHGELVAMRPPVARLTEFYLFMSLGGVLGGIVNALLAPAIFTSIFEYPLAIVAACALRPRAKEQDDALRERRLDVAVPVLLGAFTLVVAFVARVRSLRLDFEVLLAPALFLNYRWLHRPGRFAAGLGAVLVGSTVYPGHLGASLDHARNFFGVVRVTRDPTGSFVQIVHGSTIHGRQSLDPAHKDEPLSYYHPTGPIGDVFHDASERRLSSRVASIGLGAGALAYYARPGDTWTFYEINPAVVRMAKEHFSFLRDAKCGMDNERFEIGDARLRLASAADGAFDVVVLDAFSSDSIPAHLLTREAMALYVAKLAPNGVIAIHVSNRYLDLVPPIARIVAAAGLAARLREDGLLTAELQARGKSPSAWVAVARTEAELGRLREMSQWKQLSPPAVGRVWTDDFSNLVTALRW
jgi:SAM-dependent methyltransferase